MATIIIRNSTGSGAVPSSLVQGELAINTVDGKLFYGSGSGDIVKEFTGSGGPAFPYTGSALITGSLGVTGSVSVSGSDALINGITVGRGNGSLPSNTAVGVNALLNNTSGDNNNTAVGSSAMSGTTTGAYNVAFGAGALLSNQTHSYNTAIGVNALRWFTSTNGGNGNNTAIGQGAGLQIADNNTLTVCNNSVFIGGGTRANANSQTNQIVIGTGAVGLGSNTAVLGNDSITRTALKGNVSVGTTGSISSRLHVKGSGATSATTALRVENTNASASLVVLDNGYVGVGTASPQTKLDINLGAGSITNTVAIRNSGAGNYSSVTMYDNRNSNSFVGQWGLYGNGVASPNTSNMFFYNTAGGGTAFYVGTGVSPTADLKMLISSGGNILVGTSTDSGFRLDVSGSGRFTNGLTVTGSLIAPTITGSLLGTASWANNALTASYLNTLNQDLTFNGNLTLNGTASISTLVVNQTQYSSGSNQLGDAANDTQTLYGSVIIPTGSLRVSGSTQLTGSLNISGVTTFANGSSVNGSGNLSIGAFSIHNAFGYATFSATTLLLTGGTFTSTSGTQTGLSFTGGFTPTSGTATYSAYSILPTINQTGGANGITRGLYINPTLTAATDFRSIESNNGRVIIADTATVTGSNATSLLDLSQTWNTSGQPIAIKLNITDTTSAALSDLVNLQVGGSTRFRIVKSGFFSFNTGGEIQGSLIVGSNATPTSRLQIRGSGTTSATTSFLVQNSTPTTLFQIQDNGVVGINRTPTASLDVAGTTRLSGSFNTAISGSILTVIGSGSTQPIFTVQGSQGELFSITDSLTGSLFSVNDISGLPILEVFSDNTTLIGDYQDPMLITTKKVTMTNSGSFVVYSLPTASYDTAFFDYSIKSGSNARAGQIMAIQSGSSVNFTETTTTDFGSTTAVSFTVLVSGSNMVLTGSAATGSWTIKTIVRGI